jgi:hypothetical protein
MNPENKKFDSVKMMRDIREKLHQEYEKNPEKREQDLIRVRKKYMRSKVAGRRQKVQR